MAEGRDMGTVVFPQANHKFFITAAHEVRSGRRYRERVNRGEAVSRGEVEEDLKKRDEQDSSRAIAPLRPAEDATVIDTTALDPDQVVDTMLMNMGYRWRSIKDCINCPPAGPMDLMVGSMKAKNRIAPPTHSTPAKMWMIRRSKTK